MSKFNVTCYMRHPQKIKSEMHVCFENVTTRWQQIPLNQRWRKTCSGRKLS